MYPSEDGYYAMLFSILILTLFKVLLHVRLVLRVEEFEAALAQQVLGTVVEQGGHALVHEGELPVQRVARDELRLPPGARQVGRAGSRRHLERRTVQNIIDLNDNEFRVATKKNRLYIKKQNKQFLSNLKNKNLVVSFTNLDSIT